MEKLKLDELTVECFTATIMRWTQRSGKDPKQVMDVVTEVFQQAAVRSYREIAERLGVEINLPPGVVPSVWPEDS